MTENDAPMPVLFGLDMFAVHIDSGSYAPGLPDLPRLVGPFSTREDADNWGTAVIRDGEWNVMPIAWPVHRVIPPESSTP